MILNGVITLILRFLIEFDSFAGQLHHSGLRQPVMSVKYCIPVPVFHFWTKLTHPAARSLCDSWATYHMHLKRTFNGFLSMRIRF